MSFQRLRHRFLLGALLISVTGGTAMADGPAGAWRMVSYEGQAARGPVSGLLLLTDGHFSLTYTMDDGAERMGRAHAGTYEVSGNTLTYHVRWSMELSGKPSVATKPSDRQTTFSISGDMLTVTFTNGSVQKFERAK